MNTFNVPKLGEFQYNISGKSACLFADNIYYRCESYKIRIDVEYRDNRWVRMGSSVYNNNWYKVSETTKNNISKKILDAWNEFSTPELLLEGKKNEINYTIKRKADELENTKKTIIALEKEIKSLKTELSNMENT